MNQDYEIGIRLIAKAREEKSRDEHWLLYCSIYPHYTEESFMPFSEFYKPKKQVVGRSKEAILADVKKMREKYFKK